MIARVNPKVSIIIPCFNQGRFLGEAIESALSQTYANFDITIVDDGSTDETPEVAARYPVARYLRQPNQGVSTARNAGLRECDGEYLVFLDGDDRLLPNALEIGVNILESREECAFTYGYVTLIASDGAPLPTSLEPCPEGDRYLGLLRSNDIWTTGVVMHRRSILDSVGGYNTRLRNGEDFELNLRIARNFPIHCHGQVILEYRLHESNKSGNCLRMLKSTVTTLRSQRRYVRGKQEYEEAIEFGLGTVRSDYGERLINEVSAAFRRPGQWRFAAKGLMALLRYYPAGLTARAADKVSRELRAHWPFRSYPD